MRKLIVVVALVPLLFGQESSWPPGLEASITAAVDDAIREGEIPGAVVWVERVGHWRQVIARGLVDVEPARSLAADAVFDLASLTKCVATTTCVMKLIEEGKVGLGDPVCKWLPEFTSRGKDGITVEQLLRHRGGLLPDNALADYQSGPKEARTRIWNLDLRAPPPGSRYIYTDVGFIVLQWLVEAVTQQPLEVYAQEAVFGPVGMVDTRFVRAAAEVDQGWRDRCVPTEPGARGEPALRGIVHDPRARLLDGVAGHAGLFSTAADLARYARMVLREGVADDGTRVLRPSTVAMMTRLPELPSREARALGWDMRPLGRNRRGPRGHHFPDDSFGHTGFTGTSMWMDPRTQTHAIVLASRLYPDGKGDATPLRHRVATDAAAALTERPWPGGDGAPAVPFAVGVERVAKGAWPAQLRGRRVGLITNHTGRDRSGRSTIDILHGSPSLRLRALFSPEHGIRGEEDAKISDTVDEKTGLAVYSLYGDTRRPTPAMLEGLDVLVFDIQDIGARFYTYASTMVNAMEEAARHGLSFVVLDRPNPIGGVLVEGPVADADSLDFVGSLRIPIRHGLTLGEFARIARSERCKDLDLHVVWVAGWSPDQHQDETPLPWVNPSPNMRSLTQALLYPGIGILETTNISVGRGTATPFEVVGAPWMDGAAVARSLTDSALPGVTFEAITFTPDASKHAGKTCSGVRFRVTDRDALRPVRLGITLACILQRLHPDAWETKSLDRLLKHRATRDGILGGATPAALEHAWESERAAYLRMRKPFLLYERP